MSTILFLDFDGVLHPDPCHKDAFFCKLPLLEGLLCQTPDVGVVISSSWRYDHSLVQLQAIFSPEIRARVIDVTPSVLHPDNSRSLPRDQLQYHRELECREWLRRNATPQTHWVAIDDTVEWFSPKCGHLLATRSEHGLLVEQLPTLHALLDHGRNGVLLMD